MTENGTARKRILFYSHDTFGLGHIRRTQKIANFLASDERSILIACSSPKASSYSSQKGIEYLNLPGFTKQKDGSYVPRSLNIPTPQFSNLRANIILSAVRSFQPHLLVIDKEPLGVKKELLPSLKWLKEESPTKCHVACGFRDILDTKETVLKEFEKKGTIPALKKYFDSVLVYGEKSIFDFAEAYDLDSELAQKINYTGYVHPDKFLDQDENFLTFDRDLPLVTFTLGGGGDGWEYLDLYREILEKKKGDLPFNTVLLSGPFAEQGLIERCVELAKTSKQIKFSTFISNTQELFGRSELIISMGGYNTMIELAAMRKKPLILPRVIPRQEQLLRAQVFSARSLCEYIPPQELNQESLWGAIIRRLENPGDEPPRFETDGLMNLKRFFTDILK